MNLIGFGILFGLAIVALGFAWHQYRSAIRATRALTLATDELPSKVVQAIRLILQFAPEGSARSWSGAVDFVDVNNDGQRELVVQYPSGAHGSVLNVLAWRCGAFYSTSCLKTDTPVGFDFGDFDGDGKVEIRTNETDWNAGLPYVSAPRLVVLFRWDGTTFIQVSKGPIATESA